MVKRDSTEKRGIAEIFNKLLYGKIRRIRDPVCRVTLTLAVMRALDALEK